MSELTASDSAQLGSGTELASPSYAPPSSVAALVLTAADRYVLGEEIARGGMGVVHRATDTAFGREVALKFLLPGRDPGRFLGEARIAGQLQHPGIPPIYDLGTLPDGRPFLAMKLIKGDTLDDRLASKTAVDRLAVFEGVCRAVGYAHAHGVIHRDLKPQNVMVGAFGEVQVMDWGLAKVLSSGAASAARADTDPHATAAATEIRPAPDSDTPFTQYGSMLGTPAYMPPEQAAGELHKVDARSDVFGLGAVLCVLLTGRPPYDEGSAESVRVAALRGDTAAAFARLDGCGADPEVIALCKRCLAFDPTARPADGNAVANQVAALRAAADDRAAQAERDRLAAAVREVEGRKRRRVFRLAVTAVTAALAAGLTAALWQAAEARRAADAAELARQDADRKRVEAEAARQAEAAQRAKAEEKEAEANAVVGFFVDTVLAAGRPKGQNGGLGAGVSLRDAVAAGLPELATRFADRPLVEARLRSALGTTFWYLGDPRQATEQFERARAGYAARLPPDHPQVLFGLHNLANGYDALGRIADALKLREEVLAGRRRTLPPDHPDTLASMNNLASSYVEASRHAEALALQEQVLAARRRVLPPDHPDTLSTATGLANCLGRLGRHREATALYEQTLAAQRRVLPADHPDLLNSLHSLANSYDNQGRLADALRLHEQVLAARRRVLPPDHLDILRGQNEMGNTLFHLGRHADALKLREEVLAARRRLLPAYHPETLLAMNNLAISYATVGRLPAAVVLFEEVLAARRRVLPADHADTLQSLNNLARCYTMLDRHADALPLDEQALAARRRVLPPDHPDTLVGLWCLAESLIMVGRGADAVPLIDECVTKAAGKQVDPQMVPSVLLLRLRHYRATGDAAGARATAAMREETAGPVAGELYDVGCFRAVAAGLYAKANRPAEAAADADRAMDWLTKAVAAGFSDRGHLEADSDLAAVRDRADFRALAAGLRYQAPPPRRAREGGK